MIPDINIITGYFESRTYLLDPHAYTAIPSTFKFAALPNLLGLITDHSPTNDTRSQIRTQFRTVIPTNQIPAGRILLNPRIFLVFDSTVCKGRDEFELLFSSLGI